MAYSVWRETASFHRYEGCELEKVGNFRWLFLALDVTDFIAQGLIRRTMCSSTTLLLKGAWSEVIGPCEGGEIAKLRCFGHLWKRNINFLLACISTFSAFYLPRWKSMKFCTRQYFLQKHKAASRYSENRIKLWSPISSESKVLLLLLFYAPFTERVDDLKVSP